MYQITKNNYHLKPKNSTVYTPSEVSQFLFHLLSKKIKSGVILDPCSGQGSLLTPWKSPQYKTLGIDKDSNSTADLQGDFFSAVNLQYWINAGSLITPQLILCNPPFNGYGTKLASEVWLAKLLELFGDKIPLALFAPVGLRNNLTIKSNRYQKFLTNHYPPITSIITLPKNIFPNVLFHSEILIFNIKGLKSHYYLPEFTSKQLADKKYYHQNQIKIKTRRKERYKQQSLSEQSIIKSEQINHHD